MSPRSVPSFFMGWLLPDILFPPLLWTDSHSYVLNSPIGWTRVKILGILPFLCLPGLSSFVTLMTIGYYISKLSLEASHSWKWTALSFLFLTPLGQMERRIKYSFSGIFQERNRMMFYHGSNQLQWLPSITCHRVSISEVLMRLEVRNSPTYLFGLSTDHTPGARHRAQGGIK